MTDVAKIKKCHCNECGQKTDHLIVFKDMVEGRDDNNYGDEEHPYYVEWSSNYMLLQCCGCKDMSLEKTTWCSEDDPYEQGEAVYYPPRISRKKPRWFYDLPFVYHGLLNEIYAALYADSRRLAMMGARAVIDTFIHSKVGDIGNFTQKLDGLYNSGFIGSKNKDILSAALDAGNASSHRAYNPPSEQMDAVMDIIENLVQHDILEEVAQKLKKTTPQRQLVKKQQVK